MWIAFPLNLFDIVILFVRNVAAFESNAKFSYSTSYGLKQSNAHFFA